MSGIRPLSRLLLPLAVVYISSVTSETPLSWESSWESLLEDKQYFSPSDDEARRLLSYGQGYSEGSYSDAGGSYPADAGGSYPPPAASVSHVKAILLVSNIEEGEVLNNKATQRVLEQGFADAISVKESLVELTKVNSKAIRTAGRVLFEKSLELEYEIEGDSNISTDDIVKKLKATTAKTLLESFQKAAAMAGASATFAQVCTCFSTLFCLFLRLSLFDFCS